ncbi:MULTISPECIES: hypothetical protein [Paenibacillus]|uniref:hypothetical protein n=1 Tax=Paenibacillus TaxID=44249 RepID=UPI001C64A911|nr:MULTISPECIES: hypothetical protein [Paenibacillus]QYK65734.1 hypothetical protein KAI36_00870 [Paenibacillus sp. S02]WCM62193.1 hypothetical protein OYT09_04270 [Paenibacillus polymyxa]
MQISSRQYPHPVLSYNSDDFINSDFQASLKNTKSHSSYIFDAYCVTSSEGINQLIKDHKARFAFHFECQTTRYRKIFSSFDNNFNFSLSAQDIEGKVQICAFIIAVEDLESYELTEFHPDYEGYSFQIRKGDILAVDAERSFFAEKDIDPLKRIPSIFSIQPNRSEDAQAIEVDSSGNKIIIKLSQENFDYYKSISLNASFQPILSSLIVIPALVSILETLRHEETDIDYEECRWYQVILLRLKDFGIELGSHSFEQESTISIAQKLIGDPLSQSFSALMNLEED